MAESVQTLSTLSDALSSFSSSDSTHDAVPIILSASASSVTAASPLETALASLPLLQSLRSAPDASEWYESRPHAHIPESKRVNSLTAGALMGPNKLGIPPLIRAKKDETASLVIAHVGKGLCGYDGIVHGGLLATLLDEALGRQAILNLPGKVATTANLTIDYKAPTRADQFIVIHTHLVEVKGRKATVEGSIEDLKGTLLVQAKALFIEPKWASQLSASVIKEVMAQSQLELQP